MWGLNEMTRARGSITHSLCGEAEFRLRSVGGGSDYFFREMQVREKGMITEPQTARDVYYKCVTPPLTQRSRTTDALSAG